MDMPGGVLTSTYGMALQSSIMRPLWPEVSFSSIDIRVTAIPTTNDPRILKQFGYSDTSSANLMRDALSHGYLKNLAGISISSHMDKAPVRELGKVSPSGFVRSGRTVGGTLIFWMDDISPLSALFSVAYRGKLLMPDEMPLLTLIVTFITEQGLWATCSVQGCTILDEGKVLEAANGEGITVSYSYMALSMTPVMPGYFSVLQGSLHGNDPTTTLTHDPTTWVEQVTGTYRRGMGI